MHSKGAILVFISTLETGLKLVPVVWPPNMDSEKVSPLPDQGTL